MTTSDNSGAFLEDLAREILLSLPVKSLLRFKCVCKNWCSLVKNPEFTIEHLNSNKNKPPQFLIYYHGPNDDAPLVTVISESGTIASPSDEENPQRFGAITKLLGSVGGLFFLEREIDNGIDKGILCSLWNPATREVRHLPATPMEFEPFDVFYHLFGFGLDPMTKDHKVVWYYYMEEYAAVYSCSRDSWKIFKHDAHYNLGVNCVESFYNTTYLNGSYYWQLTENDNWKIISFDFGNEVFVEIEGPPDDYSIYSWSTFLILLDDSVAILNGFPESVYDVWVMIQPGVWNKIATFHCFPHIMSCYDNSLILMTKSSRLALYNVRTKKTSLLEFRHRGLRTNRNRGVCGIYCYKESLVMIKRQEIGELDLSSCLTKLVARY